MLKSVTVRSTVAAIACAISMSAHAIADAPRDVNVPAGDLVSALESLSKQTSLELLFQPAQVKAFHTRGVHGKYTPEAAVRLLIKGTPLELRTDPASGAMVIASPRGQVHSQGNVESAPVGEGTGESQSGFFLLAEAAQGQTSGAPSIAGPTSQQSGPIQEVIVTAQKREEKLQEVPVPVSVIDTKNLAENSQGRLEDYFLTVPGLTYSPAGGGEQTIAIRGITTTFDSNPTVGIVIDDVPYGSSTIGAYGGLLYPDIDPGDLARIEVLRGPQGTLYGASTLGGLIKFVTQDPSTEAVTGYVQVLGDDVAHGEAGWGARAGANIPLSDTLAIRVSGFSRRDPGYIDNVTTGDEHANQTDAYGGHLAALWRPSDAFSLKVSGILQNTAANGNSVVNTNSLFQPVMRNYQATGIRGDGAYTAHVRQLSAALNVKLAGLTLTSITGYGDNTWRQMNDFSQFFGCFALNGCGTPGFSGYGVSGSLGVQQYETKRFSEELRLASEGRQFLDWVLGGFYSHESGPGYQDYGANAVPSGALAGTLIDYSYPDTVVSEYAAFGDVTINFTDHFDLQLGGRESTYHQTFEETQTGPLVPAFDGVPSPDVGPTLRSNGNAFTYLATPRFRVSPDLMVYARIASGYRIGGPNLTSALVATPPSFSPDRTTNYELGVKGDVLDHALTFEVSAYYIEWKDIQLSEFSAAGGFTYDINGGSAKSEGVELSVTARPVQGLSISAEGTFDNAVLTESLPPTSTAYALSGDRLPYTSRFSGSLSADYDVVIVGSAKGFIGASVSYLGTRLGEFSSNSTTARFRYPGFSKTNVHVGVRHNSWLFNLFVNNLTDKWGITGGNNAFQIGNTLGYQAQIIQPRLVGLSITKTFGE